MNKYEVKVPYSELVLGYSVYVVDASSEDEVRKIMESETYYMHFYDTEQTGSSDYMEECGDMIIREMTE